MEVRLARDGAEIQAALDLRERVFCGEQGVSLASERDGRDGDALHVVAVEAGRLLGTCRVLLDDELGRFARMAVEPVARRRGIGVALLREAELRARERGARRMRLHAQAGVQELYGSSGYVTCGAPFEEEGIEHVTMEKTLA